MRQVRGYPPPSTEAKEFGYSFTAIVLFDDIVDERAGDELKTLAKVI